MQPNEQDPNTQSSMSPPNPPAEPPVSSESSSQPLLYQVPEYLKLDPIVEQKPRKLKKKFIVSTIILSTVLLIVAVVFLIWSWYRDAPMRNFMKVLETSLSTPYLSRIYTISSKNPDTNVSIDSKTDLTDPLHPKSSFSYKYFKSVQQDSSVFQVTIVGDVAILGNNLFEGRLTQVPKVLLSPSQNIQLDQWYSMDESSLSVFDMPGLHLLVNNPHGSLIVGNFNADIRKVLVDYIRDNKIYVITEVSSDHLDNRSVTKYSLAVNDEQLLKLNKKVADLIGDKSYVQSPGSSKTFDMTVWVDDSSNRVVKTSNVFTDAEVKSSETVQVQYAYPDKVIISNHDTAKEFSVR